MKRILIFGLFLFTCISYAQKPCESNPKYNEFDFWIGEWQVYDLKGNLAGSSKISKILDNCVILEEWTSGTPPQGLVFSGKSFNSYNATNNQWQQNWVDNTGGSNEYLTGNFENKAMHFISRPFKNGNNNSIRKITFYNLENGNVRQLGEISNDDGTTFITEYDLEYRKK